jgi:hypothetical protein
MEVIQKHLIKMMKSRKKNQIYSNKIQVWISLWLKWNNLFPNSNNYMYNSIENKNKFALKALKNHYLLECCILHKIIATSFWSIIDNVILQLVKLDGH